MHRAIKFRTLRVSRPQLLSKIANGGGVSTISNVGSGSGKKKSSGETSCGSRGSSVKNSGESNGLWHDENSSLRRNVGVLVGSQIMLNIGVSQMVPVLPALAAEMQLGATGIGALMATSSAARLACNLPLGKLCDTLGRKPLMQYGTLVTASGCIGTTYNSKEHSSPLAILSIHNPTPLALGSRSTQAPASLCIVAYPPYSRAGYSWAPALHPL